MFETTWTVIRQDDTGDGLQFKSKASRMEVAATLAFLDTISSISVETSQKLSKLHEFIAHSYNFTGGCERRRIM